MSRSSRILTARVQIFNRLCTVDSAIRNYPVKIAKNLVKNEIIVTLTSPAQRSILHHRAATMLALIAVPEQKR